MVMPLARGPEVIGVFELLSGMPNAFEERDLSALARLGEMVETAMDHADTAKQTPPDTFFEEDLPAPEIGVVPLKLDPHEVEEDFGTTVSAPVPKTAKPEESPLIERGTIGNCQKCGFPVSGHRRLCVECAAALPQEAAETNRELPAPSFLAGDGEALKTKSSGSAGYTVATVMILLATAAIVVYMKFPEVPVWIMQHAHLPR